jgi:hypothetical protein
MSEVRIEATGGPIACSRCGRPAPAAEAQRADWGSLFLNGRLVQLACPACLTPDERAEIEARRGGSLWEVASARRAASDRVAELAERSRAAARPAPSAAWVGRLAGAPVGVVADEGDGARLLTLWIGRDADGDELAALLEVAIADWMALEEIYVPYRIQQQATDLVRRLAG